MSGIITPPKPPPMPAPTLMEDTEAIEKARRKSVAGQKERSGVASTLLTTGGTTDTLGAG
jgi:hypothetical protein